MIDTAGLTLTIALLLNPVAGSTCGDQDRTDHGRLAASAALVDGLDRAQDLGPQAQLVVLRAAARVATDQLGSARAGLLIDAAVVDARWRATVDGEAAAGGLRSTLSELASDLAFEPLVEAPLPVGWPALTPLHEIEVRAYPRYRMAAAPVAARGSGGAFWRLFGHIQHNEIAMTAPVEMTLDERVGSAREVTMAFLYELPDQRSEAVDDAVVIVDAPQAQAVSIGLRGESSSRRVAQARSALEAWLAERSDLEASGPARVLGYNSPMVPRSRKFFEVQIPVRPVEQSTSLAQLSTD